MILYFSKSFIIWILLNQNGVYDGYIYAPVNDIINGIFVVDIDKKMILFILRKNR